MPKSYLALSFLLFMASSAEALSDNETQYLTQVLNQLEALPPLIVAAQHHQPVNQRIPFHYESYIDAKGQRHNGLLEDIQAVTNGVKAALNQPIIEPQFIAPLQGDYLDNKVHDHR